MAPSAEPSRVMLALSFHQVEATRCVLRPQTAKHKNSIQATADRLSNLAKPMKGSKERYLLGQQSAHFLGIPLCQGTKRQLNNC